MQIRLDRSIVCVDLVHFRLRHPVVTESASVYMSVPVSVFTQNVTLMHCLHSRFHTERTDALSL